MIGETIGNYKISSLLGKGGMGEVYRAEQLAVGTTVAIKVLRADVAADSTHVKRFFNEARAVGAVKHAGSVKIFDVGYHAGHAYLVMEFLEGVALGSRIRRLRRLPGAQVVELGRQIASVLDAVHTAGVTHRDLKPDNIFLVRDHELGERVKILDFGIAKLTALGSNATATQGTMGTPAYMAPEQWKNAGDVDGRADIYSLGCVLFEMACGRAPFIARSTGEACTMHLHDAPPRAATIVDGMPVELDGLIDRMLAKSADDRPSIGEVGRVLDGLRSAAFVLAVRPGAIAETLVAGDDDELAPTAPPTADSIAVTGVPKAAPSPRARPLAPASPASPPSSRSPWTSHGGTVPARRGAWWLVIAGLVAAGGSTAVVVYARADRGSDGAERTAASGAHRTPDTAGTGDAGVAAIAATPAWRDLIKAGNPFVDTHGLMMEAHQVTNAEYALATTGDAGPKPDDPIAWLTVDQAAGFCASIGAHLPTSAEWERAAAGGWGITNGDVIGPLQEWTSTVQDRLAVVRGGHKGMTPDELAHGAHQHPPFFLTKDTPKTAGAAAAPRVVASATIGFRCIASR